MQAGRIFINEIGSKGVIIKGGHSNDTDIAKIIYLLKKVFKHLKMNDLKQNIRMEQGVHFQQL